MKRSSLALWAFIVLIGVGPSCCRLFSWDVTPPPVPVDENWARVKAGEVLFKHEWQPNDPLSPGGDGLGPVFNARSCVACHHQNGPGGSGGVEHNVTTFVVRVKNGQLKLHTGVIHNSATAEKYQETLAHLDPNLPRVFGPSLNVFVVNSPKKSMRFSATETEKLLGNIKLSQRKTPALFGLGLIDGIADQVILDEAQSQLFAVKKGSDFPAGRAHLLGGGKVGRFGWKAQTARLAEFVQAACANELGLSNPGHPQPASLAQPDYCSPGLDLTQLQCDQLTAFVAALPRPTPIKPHRWSTHQVGRTLFTKIGCAECHTPNLGSVEGLYSDLLLHSMGEELGGAGSSYGGPGIQDRIASDASPPADDERRTPPLWGVADSAPYLHDGRAATLEDAIRMHGGQAATSAQLFQRLKAEEQRLVIEFLGSLKAPERGPALH